MVIIRKQLCTRSSPVCFVWAVCAPASRGRLRKRCGVSRQMGASEMLVAAGTLDSERSEGAHLFWLWMTMHWPNFHPVWSHSNAKSCECRKGRLECKVWHSFYLVFHWGILQWYFFPCVSDRFAELWQRARRCRREVKAREREAAGLHGFILVVPDCSY